MKYVLLINVRFLGCEIRNIFLAAALTAFCMSSSACSRYFGVIVNFEENSAVISNHEMELLREWSALALSKYSGSNNSMVLEAGAESTEHERERLGRMRELNVRLALLDLKLFVQNVFVSENVYITAKSDSGRRREEDGKNVAIQFISDHPDFTKPCVS